MMLRLMFIGMFLTALLHHARAEEFRPLFDGATLDGWVQRGGAAKYRVEDGAIVGSSVPNTQNSFLCTGRDYQDFILTYEYKCDSALNSGVQFRSTCYPKNVEVDVNGRKKKFSAGRVHGYQAEIDPNKPDRMWSAGIYDEGRRGWLYPGQAGGDGQEFTKSGKSCFKPGDWNHVKIECRGNHIRTWLNGTARAEFEDRATPSGFIALQVHGVGGRTEPLEVRFRNIMLAELAPERAEEEAANGGEWVSLFNGADLLGWHVNENPESFYIEDGCLVAHGNRSHAFYVGKTGHADLKNFHLKAKVKTMPSANSGIYFHTKFLESGWPDKGYESQVNNTQSDPKKTGGLYNVQDNFKAPVPDNEWFDYEIIVQGKHIVVKINGKTISDYTEPDDLDRPERSLSSGTFAIQAHDPGSKVYYKDIHVKKLD